MAAITYLTGDATAPAAPGNKIICHVCNDIGGWGRGFVLAISKRWPEPQAAFRRWFRVGEEGGFRLGAVQLVQVTPEVWVANLIGQHGIARKGVQPPDGRPPVRYEAIEEGLRTTAALALERHASVHMPRIGCGLAGGKWEEVEPIIARTLGVRQVPVFVYDLAAPGEGEGVPR